MEIKESLINDNKSCGIHIFSSEAQVHGTPKAIQGNGADLCGFAPASLRKPSVPQDPRPRLAVPTDYPTVQQAIDAIAPGGTIELAAGTYEEGLTIWKPLVLRGAGQDKTILQALPERKLVLSIIAEVQGVRLEGLQVRGSQRRGLVIYGREVVIQDALVSGNRQFGLWVRGFATVSLHSSIVSGNGSDGLVVRDSATVSLQNSTISGNGEDGLDVWESATVEVRGSILEGNGTNPSCWISRRRWNPEMICNGIEVWGGSQLRLINSTIKNNADWGLAAVLKQCGYDRDRYSTNVVFEGHNVIEGNNKSGNHKGNPGNHPWNRPGVPDGQVCLP
jgi:hypothetical protein